MNILLLGPDSRNKRIKEFLLEQNHIVISTTEEITLEFLEKQKIDFIISSGYAPIIKGPIISEYQHRIINLHISYLPYGKGIYPSFWSFFERTPKGVSIHFIDKGIDTGNIIFQKEVSFSKDDTLKTSHEKLMAELEALFIEKWDEIENEDFKLVPQKELGIKVNYHNRIDSERWIELLPERWDTLIRDVEEIGAEFSLSELFWGKYDREILATGSKLDLEKRDESKF